jgi:hypothetical protein
VIKYSDLYGNVGDNYVKFPNQTGKRGNIQANPLFADAAKGDFHLKSKGGCYDPKTKTWVDDSVTSPCIDAGDPSSPYNLQPKPNGGRIEMGAYGDTATASKADPPGPSGVAAVTAVASCGTGGGAQITVNLSAAATVEVSVTNLAGREVAVLTERDLPEGISVIPWDGRSTSGTRVPAGRYVVRVTARSADGRQAEATAVLALSR